MNRQYQKHKKLLAFLGLWVFSLYGVNAYAINLGEDRVIEINACMPRAKGWTFSCLKLADPDNNPATAAELIEDLGTEPSLLDFGTLVEYTFPNPGNPAAPFKIYNSTVTPGSATYGFYFECNAGFTGGVGHPKISFEYTEGQNPNDIVNQNNDEGLGYKGVLTIYKATDTSAVVIPSGKYRLQHIEGNEIEYDGGNFTGGYPRFGVSLTNGDEPGVVPGTEPNPFSAADSYGLFTGLLTVTMDLDDNGVITPCD